MTPTTMTPGNKKPRRGSGGGWVESACADSNGAGVLILHHPAPPVKPLSAHLRRLADLAAARAERDLAGAESARQAGDRDRYLALRRRALRHQAILVALESALLGGDK